MEHISKYMEISDPDRAQPSLNDGGFCVVPYDIQRVRIPTTAPFTHAVTYRAFPDEFAFSGHPFSSREIHIARHSCSPTGKRSLTYLWNFRSAGNICRPERRKNYIITNVSAPPEHTDPRNLIPSVAPLAYNRTMGQPFTAPIVPQSTPARVSYIGPSFHITGNFMANTPARMRSSPTHGMLNGIGNANQTIVVTDQIPILDNIHSSELRLFIEIITSRAVDDNTALLRIDRRNRNLIT